jgi:hypothetical protein
LTHFNLICLNLGWVRWELRGEGVDLNFKQPGLHSETLSQKNKNKWVNICIKLIWVLLNIIYLTLLRSYNVFSNMETQMILEVLKTVLSQAPVAYISQEAEIRLIIVQRQPWVNSLWDSVLEISNTKQGLWSGTSGRVPAQHRN